jgi:hypothetical protein
VVVDDRLWPARRFVCPLDSTSDNEKILQSSPRGQHDSVHPRHDGLPSFEDNGVTRANLAKTMGPYTATHILLDINPMCLMARDVMNLPCPVRSSRCHAQNQRDNATPRQRPAAMESQAERSGIRVSKSRGRLCITGPQYYWSSEQHLRSFLIRARRVRSQADSGQRTSWCLQAK